MDSVFGIGSYLPRSQTCTLAARQTPSLVYVALDPQIDSTPSAALVPSGKDPAGEQRILHFISRIDEECFVSLLKILDPPPDDERYRAEYRRRYQQLREVLELPPPLPDLRPIDTPTDLLS